MLPFAVQLLKSHALQFRALDVERRRQAELLLAAGEAAIAFEATLDSAPMLLSPRHQQQLLDSLLRHVKLFHASGGPLLPKHHSLIHMIQRCAYLPNPRYVSTYSDESLNGIIKRIAASSHRNTFGITVHAKYSILQTLCETTRRISPLWGRPLPSQ